MENHLLTWRVLRSSVSMIPLLFLLLLSDSFGQLSGTKYIGGTTPDYATIKAAIQDLNTQGVTAPGVTFLIRDGYIMKTRLVFLQLQVILRHLLFLPRMQVQT